MPSEIDAMSLSFLLPPITPPSNGLLGSDDDRCEASAEQKQCLSLGPDLAAHALHSTLDSRCNGTRPLHPYHDDASPRVSFPHPNTPTPSPPTTHTRPPTPAPRASMRLRPLRQRPRQPELRVGRHHPHTATPTAAQAAINARKRWSGARIVVWGVLCVSFLSLSFFSSLSRCRDNDLHLSVEASSR
jgi:hypothetical protein